MATTDCILKITAGPDTGQQFFCNASQSILGRSPRSAFRFTAATVSYEHALVTRTGDDFYIENLSANGTLLNGERLAGRTRLRPRDTLRLGNDTALQVVSVPASSSAAKGSRTTLLAAVVGLLVLLVALVLWDPFSETPATNYGPAYQQLQEWSRTEAAESRLPRDLPTYLQEAWRLESAGDRPAAAKAWERLRILLAESEDTHGLGQKALLYRRALDRLTAPQPPTTQPSDDELGAALLQFINRMARRQ